VLDLATGRRAAEPRIDRYWDLPFATGRPAGARTRQASAYEPCCATLLPRRLVADVPVVVFLSGGIDSSTVAAFAAELAGAGRVRTFLGRVLGTRRSFDETRHGPGRGRLSGHGAQRGTGWMPERCGHPATVTDFLDEPLADASIVPTYLLSAFTRRHVTVALGGDGSDELFAATRPSAPSPLAGCSSTTLRPWPAA